MIAFDVPQAAYVIDYSGNMSFEQAQRATYMPGSAFVAPHTSSPLRPQSIWVRFPAPAADDYLVASPGVGRAEIYTRARGEIASFGMRVPFAKRAIARVPPTARLSGMVPGETVFVHLAVDDESPVESFLTIEDSTTLQTQDHELELMSAFALLFIGVFLSLAAANVFVYFFVREVPYVIYSLMMLGNALFAATYVHGSSWRWLWPYASLPHSSVQGGVVILEGLCLLAFTRAFLKSKYLMPRLDRIALWLCAVLMAISIVCSEIIPSAYFGPLPARSLFIITVLLFALTVFGLGIAALRKGNIEARFFVASNGAVTVAVLLMAFAALSHYDVSTTGYFVMLMNGQAVEGWLLFGALAYRLQQTIVRNVEEHRLASTDALTTIGNRRTFDESLPREWDRCARSRSHLSVLLLDVDHFKRFNDSYGHIEGDVCLKRIAQAIRGCARRPSDVCARYGGEEFAVILGETDASGASAIAEEIAQAVRDLQIPHQASAAGFVSVSIGVASTMPHPGGSPSDLVREADAALYQAKESGRNRVATFGARTRSGSA